MLTKKSLGLLTLQGNDMTGTIPTEMGRCAQLSNLDFSRNHFDGTLPIQFANLSALEGKLPEPAKLHKVVTVTT